MFWTGFLKRAQQYDDYHNVYIRRIYPESNTNPNRPPMAGGFGYSWKPGGEVVGRIGTGFSHEMKKDMHFNPEKYIGMVAKVRAYSKSEVGTLQNGAFKGWNERKSTKVPTLTKQTIIVNKRVAKSKAAARMLAKPFAGKLPAAMETGQSYRFRQENPEKFDKSTFRTAKAADGISIVYGRLKDS